MNAYDLKLNEHCQENLIYMIFNKLESICWRICPHTAPRTNTRAESKFLSFGERKFYGESM